MARRLVAALCLVACACAHRRDGPPVITPKNAISEPRPRDLSEGGQHRGVIEFALGGATAGLSATLVTLGAVQLARAIEIRDYCEAERAKREDLLTTIGMPLDPACEPSPLGVDPFTDAKVSSALSFAFAAPIAVASAFLFRRAARIRADYRAHQAGAAARRAPSVAPFAGRTGAGLSFTLRF